MVFPGGFNQNSADTAVRRKNRRSFSVNRRRPSRKERVCNNQKAAALCLDIKIQPGIFDLFGNDFADCQLLFALKIFNDRFIGRIKPSITHDKQGVFQISRSDDALYESKSWQSLRIFIDRYPVGSCSCQRIRGDHALAPGLGFCRFNESFAFWRKRQQKAGSKNREDPVVLKILRRHCAAGSEARDRLVPF
jgi:hypothetical protein